MLNEIWDFPINLLAWLVFNLALLFNGRARWFFDPVSNWLELDNESIIELLDKDNNE